MKISEMPFLDVAILTTSRADFGLLKKICLDLDKSAHIRLSLIVSGTHLSRSGENTYAEIKECKFKKVVEIAIGDLGPDHNQMSRANCLALSSMSDFVSKNSLSFVLMLGDRFELVGFAFACFFAKVPIVHIHGGEVTHGAIDDAIRHCISKLAHYHFVSSDEAGRRLRQLGESSEAIHVVGGLGIDAISRTQLLDKAQLERALGFSFRGKNFICTIHPETNISNDEQRLLLTELFEALKSISRFPDTMIIFTPPNVDPGSDQIENHIRSLILEEPSSCVLVESLGQQKYLSLIAVADAVIGNSSSGLFEAPTLEVPSINVGRRQAGRPCASSVISVKGCRNDIMDALAKVLEEGFLESIYGQQSPFGTPGASEKIVQFFESWTGPLVTKEFQDL